MAGFTPPAGVPPGVGRPGWPPPGPAGKTDLIRDPFKLKDCFTAFPSWTGLS